MLKMKQLVSIDFHADFGMLKKPDTNDPLYITFNMLHKPCTLGILGAILGLKGFQAPEPKSKKKVNKKAQELDFEQEEKIFVAEYYTKLNHIPLGFKPIGDENGNFGKTIIKYNNGVGYANQDGGNLIISEQTLISPAYRCFLLLDLENEIEQKLFNALKNNEADFLPYFGKNESSIWWKNWQVYDYQQVINFNEPLAIDTIFIKNRLLKSNIEEDDDIYTPGMNLENLPSFMYFETLPISYNEQIIQYNYASFAYTDFRMVARPTNKTLYKLLNDHDKIVQLF
jgi:CRISPR-associated protein Cas5h